MLKFSSRRKSLHYSTDFRIFRPAVVQLVEGGRARLKLLEKQVATELKALPPATVATAAAAAGTVVGTTEGKCFVEGTEIGKAIDAYTKFVKRYALHGLLYILQFVTSMTKQVRLGLLLNSLPSCLFLLLVINSY